jgi:coenzyme F420-0:L-glutamate ligase/coenzyme F420-1:gamma-L-glutamate ligase
MRTDSKRLSFTVTGISDLDEIRPGDDLGFLLAAAVERLALRVCAHDVLVVAQKIVSKAENQFVDLGTIEVSARARELAAVTRKDPRLVELVLSESTEVLRAKTNVLIVRHRLGFVMANAGVDRSNVGGRDRALLLPRDPDASAAMLRTALEARLGIAIGVVIADSFGRAWRNGVTNVALGAAGLPALIDRRGELDRNGRTLEVTEIAFADLVASAAGLVIGEAAESCPAAIVQGLSWHAPAVPAKALIRPLSEDLFR